MKSTFWHMLGQFGRRSIYVRLMLYAILIIAATTTIRVLYVTTVLDRDAHETAADNQFATATYIAKDIDLRLRLRLRFDFNDAHGHAAGGAVLREIAQRLLGILRKSDTVARIGGDEFAVILGESGDSAQQVAGKCREAIGRPLLFEGRQLAVGVSIGIAHFPSDGATEEQLLKKADAAMYRAKRDGRVV